jgi:hypothetical protein
VGDFLSDVGLKDPLNVSNTNLVLVKGAAK